MAIIGINGYAGSGKDTTGGILKDLQPGHFWEIKKWAGKLKEIATILTGIPIEKFEDQLFKESVLSPEWDTVDYLYRYSMPDPPEDAIPLEIRQVSKPMTVRCFLQKLGTDGLRNGLHPNVWVNALMNDYIPEKVVTKEDVGFNGQWVHVHSSRNPNWIITDTRFITEAITIKNAGGIVIRVERPGYGPINDHPSEIELDGWNFDYKITASNILELYTEVENMIKTLKL